MTDQILFYYNPMSRARMVEWALEEVGVPYEFRFIDFQKEDGAKAELLKINAMGKIPTIVHKGQAISETAAILTYLGDAFPEKKLAPPVGDSRRGGYLRWLFFVAGCFETAVLEKKFPRINPPNSSTLGFGSYELTMSTIEKGLEPGPYLQGNDFTMADLFLVSQIDFALRFKTIEPRPAFTRYVELCTKRPAYQKAAQHAQAMIAKMQKG